MNGKFAYILLGFLSGSILYSDLLPRWFCQIDITKEHEDHNPGAANAIQSVGIGIGLLCLALDVGKGTIPVYLAVQKIPAFEWGMALVLLAPVVGHAFSPFRHFRGGKAIAVAFGVLIGLLPGCPVVLDLAFWFILFSVGIVIHPHKVRVVTSFGLFALTMPLFVPVTSLRIGCLLVSFVVIAKHLPILAADEVKIAIPLYHQIKQKFSR